VTQNLVGIFFLAPKQVEGSAFLSRKHKYKVVFLLSKPYGLHAYFLK